MKTKKEKLVESAKKAKVHDAMINRDVENKAGFLIIGIALLMLICCGIYWAVQGRSDISSKVTDGEKFQKEYEAFNGKEKEAGKDYLSVSISKDNSIVYVSFEEVLKLLEDGTGVLYFGFPECPWCRALVPNLLDAAQNVGVEKIYYLNALDDRDILELDEKGKVITTRKGSENYSKLLEKLDGNLSDYVLKNEKGKDIATGEKRLYFPTVVVVKDGKIVGFHEGTLKTQVDSYKELTKSEKKELTQILEEYMKETITCSGAC